MDGPSLPYGPRLTTAEFLRDLTAAQSRLYEESRSPGEDSGLGERLLERELELTIDHRLGREFPTAKREALLEAHRWLWHERRRTSQRFLGGMRLALRMKGLLDQLSSRCAAILSREEYESYFGLPPGEPMPVPVDAERLEG